LANGANSLNIANTESILGGSGADTIVLTTALTASATRSTSHRHRHPEPGQRPNSLNVANTESILGGSGADTIVLTTVLNAAGNSVDLGAGTDTLSLANGANSLNVANTESILGRHRRRHGGADHRF